MKKFVTFIAVLLAGATAFAQVHIGAGYLQQNNDFANGKDSDTALNGFYAGASFDLPFSVDGLSLSPGVYYSYLTGTTSASGSILGISLSGSSTTVEQYITVPVFFKFSVPVGPGNLFCNAGPEFAYGLSAKVTAGASVGGLGGSTTSDLYGENSNYRRYDVKVGVGAGYQIGMFSINLGFDWGLLNRNLNTNGTALHTNNLRAGIGLHF